MSILLKTIEVTITPEELAEAFWDLASDQQAVFFNHLGLITGGGNDFEKQMLYVADEGLTEEAKKVISIIGTLGDN